MAKIVLGMGSSHAPQLRLTPDEWYKRVNADKQNPELWFRGKTFTFPIWSKSDGRITSSVS